MSDNTIPKLEPITIAVRELDPDLWPQMKDWRVPVDMTIQSLGYALDELMDILTVQGREADYLAELDNAAILNSRLTKFTLICSLVRERGRQKAQAAE